MRGKIGTASLTVAAATCGLALVMWSQGARASEVTPGGEVFIDPLDISGGFMSPLTALSPRPQTQLHIVPLEFLVLDVNLPGITEESYFQYSMRLGGSIAFFERFEIGLELLPVHVARGKYEVDNFLVHDDWDDSDTNFGNMAFHFLGNIWQQHGSAPMYFTGAFRLTFPTAGDINLGDNDDFIEFESRMDGWIIEPLLIYGVTIGNMVTLSTRQGLAIFVVPDDRDDWPFRGDDQVHWSMHYSAAVAPVKWVSVVADFSALLCMNGVRFATLERQWDDAHPMFLYLDFGAKAYPVPQLSIEAAMRFGLNDETKQTTGAYSVSLNIAYEFDFAIGGVTIIKQGQGAGASGGAGSSGGGKAGAGGDETEKKPDGADKGGDEKGK